MSPPIHDNQAHFPAAPTMHEVASAAGVSHMTVHRALAGSGQVRESTRLRILAAAERLGYRPNLSARAMRRHGVHRIGLLCSASWGRTHLTVGLILGMHEALHRIGASLAILNLSDDEMLDEPAMRLAIGDSAGDGLIVAYESRQPAGLESVLHKLRVPVVWYNVHRDSDCVRLDDHAIGRAAAERLIAAGHRSLMYFCHSYDPTDPQEHYSSSERFSGAAHACAAAGVRLIAVRGRIPTPDRPAHAARALATGATAAVCYSAAAAWELYRAANLASLRIPADLSLVSCDGDWGPYAPMRVAGFSPDYVELGRMTAGALLDKLAQPAQKLAPRTCPASANAGQDTVAPPAHPGS